MQTAWCASFISDLSSPVMTLKECMVSSKYVAYTVSMSAQQYSAVLLIYTRVKSTFVKGRDAKRLLNLVV